MIRRTVAVLLLALPLAAQTQLKEISSTPLPIRSGHLRVDTAHCDLHGAAYVPAFEDPSVIERVVRVSADGKQVLTFDLEDHRGLGALLPIDFFPSGDGGLYVLMGEGPALGEHLSMARRTVAVSEYAARNQRFARYYVVTFDAAGELKHKLAVSLDPDALAFRLAALPGGRFLLGGYRGSDAHPQGVPYAAVFDAKGAQVKDFTFSAEKRPEEMRIRDGKHSRSVSLRETQFHGILDFLDALYAPDGRAYWIYDHGDPSVSLSPDDGTFALTPVTQPNLELRLTAVHSTDGQIVMKLARTEKTQTATAILITSVLAEVVTVDPRTGKTSGDYLATGPLLQATPLCLHDGTIGFLNAMDPSATVYIVAAPDTQTASPSR